MLAVGPCVLVASSNPGHLSCPLGNAACALPCAQHLAKEVVQSRKAVGRIYTNKAHMQSLSTALTEQLGELGWSAPLTLPGVLHARCTAFNALARVQGRVGWHNNQQDERSQAFAWSKYSTSRSYTEPCEPW